MQDNPRLSEWAAKYLDRLGLPLQSPSYSYLAEICTAHLCTIPFENISKSIYYRDRGRNGYLIPPVIIVCPT